MALAFVVLLQAGHSFWIRVATCELLFLSIQQLCLPSEILLSAIDIPLQKRNSDNGKLTKLQTLQCNCYLSVYLSLRAVDFTHAVSVTPNID